MKPSLRTELLFNLAFLAAVALLLGVGTVLLAGALGPGLSPRALLAVIVLVLLLDVAVFIVFGSYLVRRHVLRPVERLMQAVDGVAAGDLGARVPDAETRDFQTLAERVNRMTDHLLDAQGRLVRSEKLASVGRLAAGIAHEVGNPLSAIGTYLEVLRRRGPDADILEAVSREVERIDRIVRSLLDYARPHQEALQPVDVGSVVRGAFELLRAQGALKALQADLDVRPGVPSVLGRAHLLEQTVVNLVLNAVDAAPARNGRVVVGVRRWAYEPGRVVPPPKRADDPVHAFFPRPVERRPTRVELEAGTPGALVFVADSGPGVAPEDRNKIFDPFYTTKEPGRGTGLGLAIVARAVDDMGGVVWVDRAREGGAAFKMFFPEVSTEHRAGPSGAGRDHAP